MKNPKDCNDIVEVREELDSIDKQIIELLGIRFSYIKEVVRFKKNEEDIVAQKRIRSGTGNPSGMGH